MKKTILTFLFAVGILSAAAQDTLYIHPSEWPSNYFKASWWQVYDSLGTLIGFGSSPSSGEHAFLMFSEDTLTVYGLAAAMSTTELMYPNIYEENPGLWEFTLATIKDTSYDYVYDFLRIYEIDGDSIYNIGEDLKVHIKHTPVSYYLNTGLLKDMRAYYPVPHIYLPVIPIYERYFSEPVTVADSFYVGRKFQSYRVMTDENPLLYTNKAIVLYGLNNGTDASVRIAGTTDTTIGHIHEYEPEYYVWVRDRWHHSPLLFPILTPEDTTQHHGGGDTLSVGSASLVDRLTGVMPNPATVSAKVVSSLGLQQVELYNAAGDLVHSQQASGFSATLDLSPLPSGTYILRIATPAGTAIKKLVVAE